MECSRKVSWERSSLCPWQPCHLLSPWRSRLTVSASKRTGLVSHVTSDQAYFFCFSEFRDLTVSEVTKLSSDTFRYRLAFSNETDRCEDGYSSCWINRSINKNILDFSGTVDDRGLRHISIRTVIDSKPILREYTPTSRMDQEGFLEITVKLCHEGRMSSVSPSFDRSFFH